VTRLNWPAVLEHAADIVNSYATGVTLRQLFYRLVADGTLPNTQPYYDSLSNYTAKARRNGGFPNLSEAGRPLVRWAKQYDPDSAVAEALRSLVEDYNLDRQSGQASRIVLGVEKAGLSNQMQAWFSRYHFPQVALGGYASETLEQKVRQYLMQGGAIGKRRQPTILIYAGDFDPSGVDILRDFQRQVDFSEVVRVGLNIDQIEDLPFNPYPETKRDTRRASFEDEYGDALENMGLPRTVQYEVDALPPERLQALFQEAIEARWDKAAYDAVLESEVKDRTLLGKFADRASDLLDDIRDQE
jgi:hypothetical protein